MTNNNKSFKRCKQRGKNRCPYLYRKGRQLTCTFTNTALQFSEMICCPEICPEDESLWRLQLMDNSMNVGPEIILIEDSREQKGYGSEGLFKTPHVVRSLECGDYSVLGSESLVSIERKSLSDLLSSLTTDRTRFETELKRAKLLHRFFVVCETCPEEILRGDYRSKANPVAVWETLAAFMIRYSCFLFAQDRRYAARLVESLLQKYVKEHFRAVDSITKASRMGKNA